MKRRILRVTLFVGGVLVFAVFMRILVVFVMAIVAFCGVGLPPPPDFAVKWNELRLGMSQDEVAALLGDYYVAFEPIDWEKTDPPPDERTRKTIHEIIDKGVRDGDEGALDAKFERWHYGSGVFESIWKAPPHAYVIYFDNDKRVVAFRAPREE
jgi:hypothetical protein